MHSLDTDSQTPLRYKHRSPVIKFLRKNSRTLLSKSSNCQNPDLILQGQHSRILKEANSFDLFPIVKTPPAKRFSRIVNPFEAALSERLHLPLIGSPTLFQRPQTPQHSSTQFAWTIDDVSSLQPANVEPHEAQFHQSPDPEYEAKAQSAISSYFKEQQIVPSPIDCPLRNQRIILSEYNTNTPISKPGRRIRDNVTQTVLSLPPILPKDLETVLAPYFCFNENQQCSSTARDILGNSSLNSTDHDVRDASLRRKLFDYQGGACIDDDAFADTESCVLTVNSPPPQSPEVVNFNRIFSDELFHNTKKDPDSLDKSSFGSLSPICQISSQLNLKRKSRISSLNSSKENNSVSRPFSSIYENYRCSKGIENTSSPFFKSSFEKCSITPDQSQNRQSSSPYQATSEMSIDSMFNVKISGLLVDTTKRTKPPFEVDLFAEDTQYLDEDDMQVSQLSAISNISSDSDTPRSKRRSASRKNLSQSFSFQCYSNNEVDTEDLEHGSYIKKGNKTITDKSHCEKVLSERLVLYRTDSGFNEMSTTSTQCDTKFANDKYAFQSSEKNETVKKHGLDTHVVEADVSMMRCSTPSKHYGIH